ncbi:MAG TPA: F0F1 ATP synthase subunit B [Phycisphaerae bacterium]
MIRSPRSGHVVGAVASVAFASLARAEETGGHGEPSLFAGDIGNVIWTLVIFGLVLVVLGKWAWRPILTALQRREEFIRNSLDQAKKDRDEATRQLKEYADKIQRAREEASAIVEEGRRDAEAVKQKIQAEARQEAELLIQRAKREIGLARDTAVKDLYQHLAELITRAASSIIRKDLTPADHERLIAESIEELAARPPSGNGEFEASGARIERPVTVGVQPARGAAH